MTPVADMQMWGMAALMLPLVGLGAAQSGRLAGADAGTARRQGLLVCTGIASWLLAVGVLASAGFFAKFDASPPRLPAVPLIAFATGATLMTRQARQRADLVSTFCMQSYASHEAVTNLGPCAPCLFPYHGLATCASSASGGLCFHVSSDLRRSVRQAVQARITAAPRHWLIAAQTFRLGVEWVLHSEYLHGRAPIQVGTLSRNPAGPYFMRCSQGL